MKSLPHTSVCPPIVAWLQLTLLVTLVLMAGIPRSISAQLSSSKEYQVKAAFLFNFAQFAEWPTAAFADSQAPMVIGILGDDPFGAVLDDMVRGENINGHPLLVQRYRKVEEIKSCHILFISQSESKQLEQVIASLKGRSLLTVGETEWFAQKGGVIRFVTEKNKIRFRVNLEAAKTAQLTISSKLLKAAEIVTPGKD